MNVLNSLLSRNNIFKTLAFNSIKVLILISILNTFKSTTTTISSYCLAITTNHNKASATALNKIQETMGQAISSTQFFVYGKRHFTKTGYLRHIQEYYVEPVQTTPTLRFGEDGADNANLTNKVVIVTGANSGLGKMVATYCAAKGAKLYMICRDAVRGEQAKQDIVQQTSTGTNAADNIQVLLADVGELNQVRRVVEEIQNKETKIHALVCNAGVLLHDKKMTSEKNEVTFASHLLGGTYLLASLLIPQLKAAEGGGRVITVTSGGMYNSKIPTWDMLTSTKENHRYDGTMCYSYVKRGQVVLTEQWANVLHKDSGVTFVTVHPGWSDTPAVDEAFGSSKKYLEPLRTPWEGAEGLCWLVQTSEDNIKSGELYLDRKIQRKHIAGPFMTEGTFTKNTPSEIQEFMDNLEKAAGL